MELSEDIVFQILVRLPLLSLLRFRCVCKRWCAVIKSSFFKDTCLALRRARAVDDEILGLKVNYDHWAIDKIFVTGFYSDFESLVLSAALAPPSATDFEIPAWAPPPSIKPESPSGNRFNIISYVNGLICVQGENWFDITIVNPALREYRKLPPILNLGGFKCDAQGIGFGYDDVTDEYKVVAIVTVFEEDGYESPYKHLGLVYHLSTNSWTLLGDMCGVISECYVSERYFMGSLCEESIFSHGSIHWCIGSFPFDPIFRILAFNTTNELFHEIEFPHGWTSYDHRLDTDDAIFPHLFNVDKSTIALVGYTSCCSSTPIIEVWVMKEYGDSESWTKQYSVSSLPIRKALSFWRKDKLVLIAMEGWLICYDLFKGQLCEPEVWVDGWNVDGWEVHLVTGHESFVSVRPV